MASRKKKMSSGKPFNVDLAEQRIERLFLMAKDAYAERPELSDRYVDLARRISMRHRVGIPAEFRRRICKKCYSYLSPGANSRVRIDGKNIIITCLECDNIMRMPYK
ncbi:ribonuclease P [Methanocella sp. CWC-04]|uniref:Ribonuclease P protein component 4 n=1 Tax=Methanooceanicella nereidis TaxID=2052831 RepID=A0AAP2RGH1_9EURY|nr:ribonuclease P protein component 4 [Methanocella sp. CWC-04]MCD1296361.1 ribonuclease P [Methanocella sp. CWC-04]